VGDPRRHRRAAIAKLREGSYRRAERALTAVVGGSLCAGRLDPLSGLVLASPRASRPGRYGGRKGPVAKESGTMICAEAMAFRPVVGRQPEAFCEFVDFRKAHPTLAVQGFASRKLDQHALAAPPFHAVMLHGPGIVGRSPHPITPVSARMGRGPRHLRPIRIVDGVVHGKQPSGELIRAKTDLSFPLYRGERKR
jgi:hypothetical protein